ncbi:selenide, water dikinase SelD [Azospirillum canadense]|uniref:selenide, water dikinase SelD n=1 Tax=Azospirillum canadense TaxID=403962 RepID=UPI002226B5B6|nr:selenide, water dikinase SelD [Azospirillum canadense]MCW2240293.1 selenide,water dikinase [Azospirillum canadense]
MQTSPTDGPIEQDLVLVGGGHAHVHVLKSFGMRPLPGVRLTLVARDLETPYSGMVPGFIAGHYQRDDCHIDLVRLARFAGARLIHAEAVGLDRAERRVLLSGRPPLRYDVLSLDTGSRPTLDTPGAAEHAIPLKPIDGLIDRWERLADRLCAAAEPLHVAMVGGGAAGVEVVLSMQRALRHGCPAVLPRFTLVTRGRLLDGHPPGVARVFRRLLAERGVELREEVAVASVAADGLDLQDGARIACDAVVWATQAGAAPWLAGTGLVLDERGFIAVDAGLRSLNDPLVFAAGDVASVQPHPRPKAGVFAVRQGPPLVANLRRTLAGQDPRPFTPQKQFLSLIGAGDAYAVASRGSLVAEGAWVWRLKQWIDRRWMRDYQDLTSMRPVPRSQPPAEMRCGGCGAKVPAAVLARVLERLDLPGTPTGVGDDAAVVALPAQGPLLQTVDFFRAFVDDPYVFGRIAATHALGDIHAMGGTPLTALAIAGLPPARGAIQEDDLYQMLRGGLEVLEGAGARLVGGHSAETAEPGLGFAVTGIAGPTVLRKGGLRPGDALVLTKPLGTGVVMAAAMQGRARAPWVAAALEAMQRSSGPAAACLVEHGAVACTDVTGFGLLGHLLEMLDASEVDATLDLGAIAALPGALELLGAGVASTLHPENARAGARLAGAVPDARTALLFDPQTAGGLLAGVPSERAEDCVRALHDLGHPQAAVIGAIQAQADPTPRVVARAR